MSALYCDKCDREHHFCECHTKPSSAGPRHISELAAILDESNVQITFTGWKYELNLAEDKIKLLEAANETWSELSKQDEVRIKLLEAENAEIANKVLDGAKKGTQDLVDKIKHQELVIESYQEQLAAKDALIKRLTEDLENMAGILIDNRHCKTCVEMAEEALTKDGGE